MKRSYELTVVLSVSQDQDTTQKQVKAVEALVEKTGGKILHQEEWGERPLAYPIAKQTHGFYLHYLVELPANKTSQFEAKLKLNKHILRQLLVKQAKPAGKKE